MAATRGDFMYALFQGLGLEQPASSGRFSDAGYLDGIASTLNDLGIVNGVAPGRAAPFEQLTRGQAFTMIARALGLAGPGDDIASASKALVDAGIVKGYGDNPLNLGLNDPLAPEHMDLLIKRIQPELDRRPAGDEGPTVRERIQTQAMTERDQYRAESDPAFAAFLRNAGLRQSEIRDEINLRTALFDQDTDRRELRFEQEADESRKGIGMDFENRGLFKSGTRLRRTAESDRDYMRRLSDANYEASKAHEAWIRSQEQTLSGIDRDTTQARFEADQRSAEALIEEPYG